MLSFTPLLKPFTSSVKFRLTLSVTQFIAVITVAIIVLYNLPLFAYAIGNLNPLSLSGIHILLGMVVVLVMFTALFLYVLAMVSRRLLKLFCMLMVLINSVALYFTVNYQVILDRTMMGNIFNTRYAEAADFFSVSLLVYVILLGLLPAWLIFKTQITPIKRLKLSAHMLIVVLASLAFIYASSSTWLWFDKHGKQLGARIMPWSYTINALRYKIGDYQANREQVLLPPATFTRPIKTDNSANANPSTSKNVVILVIGESARAQNFSLYGYERDTNPLLGGGNSSNNSGNDSSNDSSNNSNEIITLNNATSCATYTTAAVACMLSHQSDPSAFAAQYEPLPSYLHRAGVDVIWRTRNFGEPPIEVDSYEKSEDLQDKCTGDDCDYDGVLLTELKQRITESDKQNVFVVLHQHGSHGPAYAKKYPKTFEVFKPVCDSVELRDCNNQSLINAYDNSLVYTDYFLNNTINMLKELGTSSTLIYMSDHGESLGEHNVYLHGTPYAVAPNEQKDVPFLVWMSPQFMSQHHLTPSGINQQPAYSQANIFHSVMGAFHMTSDIYNPQLDIFYHKSNLNQN